MKKAYHQKHPEDGKGQVFLHGEKESTRINKYLADCDFCSRRGAEEYITEGRVTIDGEIAMMGSQVFTGQQVMVDEQIITKMQTQVYIALNKPVGITCTLEQTKAGNIGDFMGFEPRVFPIGRLDKDSSGLILLTNDGDIVNKILHAENNHEKEYIVEVDKAISPMFIEKLKTGVEITNMRTKNRVVTKKSKVERVNANCFKITLTQGLNRQIRRMCTELGYRVTALQRVRIMNIELGNLKVGHWRYLTQKELTQLADSIGEA